MILTCAKDENFSYRIPKFFAREEKKNSLIQSAFASSSENYDEQFLLNLFEENILNLEHS